MEEALYGNVCLLVFLSAALTKHMSSSSGIFGKFQIQTDSFLIGNALYDRQVRSFTDCAAVCLADGNCTSVNFAQLNFLCKIIGELEAGSGGEVTSMADWSHAVLVEKDLILTETFTTTQSLTTNVFTSKGTTKPPTTTKDATTVLTTLKEKTTTLETTTEGKTTAMTTTLQTTTTTPTTKPPTTTSDTTTILTTLKEKITTLEMTTEGETTTLTTTLQTTTTAPTTIDRETTPVPEISECGQYVRRECIVTSPGYPGETPHDLNCDLIFEAPEDHVVFINVEDMEMFPNFGSCKDKFKFHDGETSTQQNIDLKVCGSDTLDTPAYFLSSGRHYLSRLVTDGAGRSRGYKYSVHFIKNVCGKSFNIPANGEKRIVSPGYSIGRLPGDLECEIVFTSPNALRITFTYFDLDCSNRLEIYDGASTPSSLIADLCGNSLPGSYTTSANAMYLWLETDGDDYSVGFEAVVTDYAPT